ncbi:hypothetical protein N7492_001641 [Penicillium capsulatum]|uniref:Xylanolytic transcriptional activator regulatory domain-containing protein n=1 Tax=Penicillium capsulatum TaxID=69766 RepID=A0A9W9ISQ5_9EURO|nr:hypothetical protein N7492_001641 [Penicillium capsulatum]
MSPSDENYAIHKVSLKRTRQACGPCRRKKARCPGEKPVCSLASDQRRSSRPVSGYSQQEALERSNDSIRAEAGDPRRLQRIEHRLEEISSLLRDRLPRTDTLAGTFNERMPHARGGISNQRAPELESGDTLSDPLDSSVLQSEVQIYLKYFHDKPYCVFSRDWLLANVTSLPSEIAFPLVALTCRLSVHSPGIPGQKILLGRYCTDRAWSILTSQYRNRKTGLSFLQGNFLLAQLDFADGNADRGCTSIGLGLRVIQSRGLNQGKNFTSLSGPDADARTRITWAYFMLDRAQNASRNYAPNLSDNHFTLCFPSTTSSPPAQGSLHDKTMTQGHKTDQGILVCLIQLYSLWGKATEWVFEPFVTNSLPPWQTGSALAVLDSEWLEFETQFADKHRWMNVDFKRRAREEPESRDYLCTWLCVQFLFHGIQCLFHHPFVTMIKLRHLSCNLSATFLQKSFESSLLHSRWIARFIKDMTEVDLRLWDPFFGYLAAIAATIQLEHTGNKNPKIALLVNSEYRVLVGFITDLSSRWDSMKVLVNRVNELAARRHNYGSLFYNQDGYSGALSSMPTPSNLPRMSEEDEALMWDIMDLTSLSSAAPTAELTDLVPLHGAGEIALEHHNTMAAVVDAPEGSGMATDSPDVASSDPTSWPFANREDAPFGTGVPDIPDWVIFGDFMSEHL